MILITGATGYIGSHTWVELLEAGFDVIGLDNLANSTDLVLPRIRKITNKEPKFINLDLLDGKKLEEVFLKNEISGVVHFAAMKAVGDSVKDPIKYYSNNLLGLLNLANLCLKFKIYNFVFSSSATVYHPDNPIPYVEDMPLGSSSPYGWSKVMSEQILRDIQVANESLKVAYLRYFNPVGAHPSGEIGEDPKGIPNNLMPFINQVAIGKRKILSVYGDNWPTRDGTAVRDYIHVVDLAQGHLLALNFLKEKKESITVNLGTGIGYSVLDLIKAYEQASSQKVLYEIVGRRPGDIAEFFADSTKAKALLGWQAKHNLFEMCQDSWNWQKRNPDGYMT